jgi:hypothetical protein
MKTKILTAVFAFALLTSMFAGLSLAGEANSIVGTTTPAALADGASVEMWNTDRSLEIVSDLVGPTGLAGASTNWMSDVGNWNSPWVNLDTARAQVSWMIGNVGYSVSGDLTLISGSGFQLFPAASPIAQMVVPTGTHAGPGTFQIDLTWAPPASANVMGYLIYRSTDNATWALIEGTTGIQAGFWWAQPCNLERATAWHVGNAYSDTTIPVEGVDYYYAIRYVYGPQTDGLGIPTTQHGLWGLTNPDGSFSPVYSAGSDPIPTGGAAGTPPETFNLGDAPDPHDGNVVTDFVTIQATVDDSMHSAPGEPHNINAAEYRVDGGAWNAMTPSDGTFDSPTEGVQGAFWFPPGFTEGPHTYEVHGSDAVDGYNLTVPYPSGTFTVTDITAPLGDYTPATPMDGANRAIGNPVQIWCWYEDFTAYSSAVLYWWNATEGFRANSMPMNNNSFIWNSYYNVFEQSFTVYGAAGDTITYEVELQDSSAGGPLITVLAQRTIIPFDAADQPQDPYPIYGYTYQYDGTSVGGYAPLLITGCTVAVSWLNSTTGAYSTISYTDIAGTGQYSVDILNYTEGGYVFCNVTANPNTFTPRQAAGNLGYNWTTIEVIAVPGGRMQNVTCGVPWNVTWIQPLFMSVWAPASLIPTEYIITDRDGEVAPGYYNFGGPAVDRGFVNITCGPLVLPGPGSYTAPLDKVFEGTADPDPGGFLGATQIFTPGDLWYMNVSEGGQIFPDVFFLTDWGAWWLDPLNTIPGWLKDWDNTTIYIQPNSFEWELEQGWNLVSCPQEAVFRQGANLFFDAQDALNWTNMYMINILLLPGDPALSIADRTGGNPSTYATYDLDTGEAGAFPLDTLHGYWVYTSLPGPNIISFGSVNATTIVGTTNIQCDLFAGWNLQGFQHNYTAAMGWTVWPTASMFTDGTVDPALNVPAFWKIVATEWQEPTDWYISYVVTNIFPGMADKNWVWDQFSFNPGVGFWLWVPADITITYDCTF